MQSLTQSSFPPRELLTSRLRLRLPKMRDAQAIYSAYASDPKVTRYLQWQPHQDVDETRFFLADTTVTWAEGYGHRPWVLEYREGESPTPLGMLGVTVVDHTVELGYVLCPAHQGQGLMSEAVHAVVASIFDTDHLYRIYATCHTDNLASQRLLERCGFTKEGRLNRFGVYPNLSQLPEDVFMYARTRSENALS